MAFSLEFPGCSLSVNPFGLYVNYVLTTFDLAKWFPTFL